MALGILCTGTSSTIQGSGRGSGGWVVCILSLSQENLTSAVALYDRSVQCLHDGEFTSKHTVYSAQAICVLLQVAHNFDQSDMIAVLVAAAIKICQCLNVHRLGPDREELTIRMDTDMAVQYLIEREVKKRVWWFLIRQDWLQIPFQNTYLVHASQFNTPMPINCHDNLDRMICDGRVVAQPEQVYTQCSYTHGISLGKSIKLPEQKSHADLDSRRNYMETSRPYVQRRASSRQRRRYPEPIYASYLGRQGAARNLHKITRIPQNRSRFWYHPKLPATCQAASFHYSPLYGTQGRRDY